MAGMTSAAADAMKKALFAIVRSSRPTVDYFAYYSAKVVVQSADRSTVDVVPEDSRLPSAMAQVPLDLGIPGATVAIPAGAMVMVGWRNGDPQRAYAFLFQKGAEVFTISITAAKIELGGEGLVPLFEQVLIGKTPCQFTGSPHSVTGVLSKRVFAKET